MARDRKRHVHKKDEDEPKKKGKGKKESDGDTVYGPYKGSDKNGGRPIYVIKRKDGSTTSTDKARLDYERKHHTTLSRDTDVDHKNNKGRAGDDRESNLQAMSHSKNVAKENKRRGRGKKD